MWGIIPSSYLILWLVRRSFLSFLMEGKLYNRNKFILPFSTTYVWDLTSERQNFIHMLFSLMFLNIRVLKLRTFGVNQNSQFHLSLFFLELFFIAMNKVLMLLAKSNCSKSVSCQIGFSDDYVDILKLMMCQMKRCIYLFQITEHTTFKQKMNRNT